MVGRSRKPLRATRSGGSPSGTLLLFDLLDDLQTAEMPSRFETGADPGLDHQT
jgi:hypothetical protein